MRQASAAANLDAVADVWVLLTDDATERSTFATAAATLALPAVPAAPPNRLRRVTRITTAHGTYFLKTFAATQWQNRLRFLATAPRANDDAQRELLVTQALHANGFRVPRPVAYGRRGRAATYLCAALPGAPLRDLLAQARAGGVARAAAEHCGRLLARGFWLPDLSADHVFVHGDELAVLDLHNGRVTAPCRVPPRVLGRVLRRFRRSVADLALPWPAVLRFAARLLRAAGCTGARARAVLRRQPPWATAARYDAAGKSRRYAERSPVRTARELRLLVSVWPGRAGETVLDLPCGAGRLLPLLRDELRHEVLQADGSLAMLRESIARNPPPRVPAAQADALAMPFAAGAVDGVVTFRFLHHLPADAAATVVAEACRVARRFVVVSFFHPCSLHHLQRRVRTLLGGRHTRFATTLGAVQRTFAAHGFALAAHAADAAFTRDLWVAAFTRSALPEGGG